MCVADITRPHCKHKGQVLPHGASVTVSVMKNKPLFFCQWISHQVSPAPPSHWSSMVKSLNLQSNIRSNMFYLLLLSTVQSDACEGGRLLSARLKSQPVTHEQESVADSPSMRRSWQSWEKCGKSLVVSPKRWSEISLRDKPTDGCSAALAVCSKSLTDSAVWCSCSLHCKPVSQNKTWNHPDYTGCHDFMWA